MLPFWKELNTVSKPNEWRITHRLFMNDISSASLFAFGVGFVCLCVDEFSNQDGEKSSSLS